MFLIIFAVVGYILAAVISFVTGGEEITFGDAVASTNSFIGLGVGAVFGLIVGLFPKKQSKYKNEGHTAEGDEREVNFDSKFITLERLRTDKDLIASTWNELPKLKKTGFVFRNKEVGGKYEVNMKPETHALVLGTTGTGKTQIFANPTIRILAHTGQKPSLVMTDPKGELYTDNAEVLRKEGYNIVVLNLENPYASSRWNPMEIAYRVYERAGNLRKEVKKYSNCTPEQMGFKKFSAAQIGDATYGNVWYGFDGKAFPNEKILEEELEAIRIQLEGKLCR